MLYIIVVKEAKLLRYIIAISKKKQSTLINSSTQTLLASSAFINLKKSSTYLTI